MKWFKEVSKLFLNLILVTVVVFFYGSITNPDWRPVLIPVGLALIVSFALTSYVLWKKGGNTE